MVVHRNVGNAIARNLIGRELKSSVVGDDHGILAFGGKPANTNPFHGQQFLAGCDRLHGCGIANHVHTFLIE